MNGPEESNTEMDVQTGSREKGFTIIELMAVVAVVSILAVIALAAYQDYAIRAQVSEGLALATEAKSGVMDRYYLNNVMPSNNSQAGLEAPDDYETDIVASLSVTDGTISISYQQLVTGVNNVLHIRPVPNASGTLEWVCEPAATNGISINYIPPNCRN